MSKILVYSSITKKIIMGALGLFLALFLLVHLSINLLMLAGDDGKMFTEASNFMTTNIFVVMKLEASVNILPSSPASIKRLMERWTSKNKARNSPKAPMMIFLVIEE